MAIQKIAGSAMKMGASSAGKAMGSYALNQKAAIKAFDPKGLKLKQAGRRKKLSKLL